MQTNADLLAARCLASLHAIEAGGGPDVASHLAVIRRALTRRRAGGRRDRDRVRRAVATIADAGTGEARVGELCPREHRALLEDLRQLDRVLSRSARIGTSPTGTSPTGTSPTGTSPTGASPTGTSPTGASPTGAAPLRRCHRADG